MGTQNLQKGVQSWSTSLMHEVLYKTKRHWVFIGILYSILEHSQDLHDFSSANNLLIKNVNIKDNSLGFFTTVIKRTKHTFQSRTKQYSWHCQMWNMYSLWRKKKKKKRYAGKGSPFGNYLLPLLWIFTQAELIKLILRILSSGVTISKNICSSPQSTATT